MYVDSHTHLDDFPPEEIDGVLERARAAGVGAIMLAGTTLESTAACVELARSRPMLLAGVGIHPMDVTAPVDGECADTLRRAAMSSPKVVTMSETGLDFDRGAPDLSLQYQAFRAQIRLGLELGLPVIFHSREIPGQPELHMEALKVLRQEQGWRVGGAMHYFQGDERSARECMELGFYVSLAKPLLRRPDLQAIAADLPLESIVLETDTYPQPFKGSRDKWTEPRDVPLVARKLAELKDVPVEEIERATTANFLSMCQRAGAPGRADAVRAALEG
ncbi:MAG: TatD family hydrolase [Chloroflexota bacterium]|nr:TatD family hydrolase [Chloroflexota bacterium]MDE2968898.1 TatD family hydrolase [Chloroflexota bacterium]